MNLQPFKKFRNIINIEKPKVLGSFSVDDKNQIVQNDFSNLKYLKIPKEIQFDLKKVEHINRSDYVMPERISLLISFIIENKDDVMQDNRIDADFVCFRGVLRCIMESPFEKYNSWIIQAIKFKGTIYFNFIDTKKFLVESLTRAGMNVQAVLNPEQHVFKFQRFIFSNSPSSPPVHTESIAATKDFFVVLNTKVDAMKILFGMKVGGVKSDKIISSVQQLQQAQFIEAKLRARNGKQLYNFLRFKARSWFCNTFIAGIDEVYLGISNDDGVVDEIRTLKIDELEGNQEIWSNLVCKNFLKLFLQQVQSDLQLVDDPKTIYEYQWHPSKGSRYETVQLEVLQNQTFFPEEFINFMQN